MQLDILETEDSCIDVDTIILKIKSNHLLIYFHFILFLKFHFNIALAFK